MIRTFFKFLFRTFFWVCALLGFIFVSLGLVFYFVGFTVLTPTPKPLAQDSVLSITLQGAYVEHTSSKGLDLVGRASLYDLTRAIYQAAQDPSIRGILVRLGDPDLGMAQFQEVREALLAFRKTGKPSWCYTESFGEVSSGTNPYIWRPLVRKFGSNP